MLLFLQVPPEKNVQIPTYNNKNKERSSSMKVRMARHIVKLQSLSKSNNDSNNNNEITLNLCLYTYALRSPYVNKQAASNLYMCCVPEVLL